MPQQQLDNLITRLHDRFGSSEVSPQQQQLLDDLQRHSAGGADTLSLQDSANAILEELEIDHPKAAAVLREIVETLGRLGV